MCPLGVRRLETLRSKAAAPQDGETFGVTQRNFCVVVVHGGGQIVVESVTAKHDADDIPHWVSAVRLFPVFDGFDAGKRAASLEARGLDMARAGGTLTVEDDRRGYGENRLITVGYLDGTMVVLVRTPRDEALRIISMRKVNDRERKLYTSRF